MIAQGSDREHDTYHGARRHCVCLNNQRNARSFENSKTVDRNTGLGLEDVDNLAKREVTDGSVLRCLNGEVIIPHCDKSYRMKFVGLFEIETDRLADIARENFFHGNVS